MKIILYGLGQGCLYVRKQILKKTEIIAYSDSYSDIGTFLDVRFVKPSEIKNIEFDYIVVTIIERLKAWEVTEWLCVNIGIDKERIIPYFCCCNTELYKNKISNCNTGEIDMLVIGNSHAQRGLLETEFRTPVLNLSSPGIDLYMIKNTLLRCVDRFENLRRVLVDLFDYTYFNIDASRIYFAESVYLLGGILSSNHLRENKLISDRDYLSEDDALRAFLREVNKIDISRKYEMQKLFRNTDLFYGEEVENVWTHINVDEPLNSNMLNYRIREDLHKDTVKENMSYLEEIIKITEEHKVELILTLLPQYIRMEDCYDAIGDKWKPIFKGIINDLLQDHKNVVFFDMKKEKQISSNPYFYYDTTHLNTPGACAMTSLLCKKIYA